MITQAYALNLVPQLSIVRVRCSQYDADSRIIRFNLFNGSVEFTVPDGAMVSVRGTKKDKKGFEYPCVVEGSAAQFAISEQMTLYPGEMKCELRIATNDKVLGSANFVLDVEETPLDGDTAISASEYPIYERLVARAETAQVNAATYAQNAQDAAQAAEQSAESIDPNPITSAEIDTIVSA